uniref:Uncharacterized protein n=1 Tax=Ditylum brightwellii TaxID=49249 RepID=A0A6U3RRT2_9STRA|mmetsp:Transcript_23244/g.34658  ORF Transcript_23244/g.34658 Transcript_23244/m.34658 type:complete len:184 (+) Transcript_23244:109-660(+)
MTRKIFLLTILVAAITLPTCQCFSPLPRHHGIISPSSPSLPPQCRRKPFFITPSPTSLNAVTEDDVIEAVEKAEALWVNALEARKKANALVDVAEGEATSASESADTAMEALNVQSGGTFGMSNVETAKGALNAALDAGSKVDQAVKATEEADKLEKLAEEALAASEVLLEQHLIDFPEQNED